MSEITPCPELPRPPSHSRAELVPNLAHVNKMSLADELLADLEEVGEDDDQQHELGDEIMDAAAEQLEDLAKMADKSVRAVAKLGESREVSDVMVLISN